MRVADGESQTRSAERSSPATPASMSATGRVAAFGAAEGAALGEALVLAPLDAGEAGMDEDTGAAVLAFALARKAAAVWEPVCGAFAELYRSVIRTIRCPGQE